MQRIRSAQRVLEHEETSVIAPMCKWKKEKGEGGNRRKMGTNILKRTVIRGEDATNKDGTNDRACKWVVHLAQLVEICFIRRLDLSFRSDFRSSHRVSWYVERVRSPCTRVTIASHVVYGADRTVEIKIAVHRWRESLPGILRQFVSGDVQSSRFGGMLE